MNSPVGYGHGPGELAAHLARLARDYRPAADALVTDTSETTPPDMADYAVRYVRSLSA